MYNSYGTFYRNGYSELYHHGVKGQKWGKRRYQNPDGSLTPEGRVHYNVSSKKATIKGGITTAAGIGTMILAGAVRENAFDKVSDAKHARNTYNIIKSNPAFYGIKPEDLQNLKNKGKKVTSLALAAANTAALTNPIIAVGGAAALAGLGIIGYGAYKRYKLHNDIQNEAFRKGAHIKVTNVV